MVVHQVFAMIYKEKVENVMVCDNYELANQLAVTIYGVGAIAVNCLQYPCGKGDVYKDGMFYRGDIVIERIPTEAEKIKEMEETLNITQSILDEQKEIQENILVAMLEV